MGKANQTVTQTEQTVRSFLERLAERDPEGMAALFAEQIDWYVPGDTALPWIGHRSQPAEVTDFFRNMWPHFIPGKSRSSVEKLIVSGNDAVMFGTLSHTAANTGRSWNSPVAMHLTVTNGKIVRFYLYEDTWAVSKAFFD